MERDIAKPAALPATSSSDAEDKRTGVEIYRLGFRMAFIATACALVIFILLAMYFPPRTGRLSLETEIAMVLGMTAYIFLLALFGSVQRIDIDHDRRTIRVANKDTYQRWLGFRMEEVTGIRRLDGYRRNALAMDLALAPGRSSRVAIFNHEEWLGADQSVLFVALVTAVLAVNPEVELTGFPATSSDAFRRPRKSEEA